MWNRAHNRNVKYWQSYDNKCQWRPGEKDLLYLNYLFLMSYIIMHLAQKLLRILSPIKKHLLVKENKNHQEVKKEVLHVKKSERFYTD